MQTFYHTVSSPPQTIIVTGHEVVLDFVCVFGSPFLCSLPCAALWPRSRSQECDLHMLLLSLCLHCVHRNVLQARARAHTHTDCHSIYNIPASPSLKCRSFTAPRHKIILFLWTKSVIPFNARIWNFCTCWLFTLRTLACTTCTRWGHMR